MVSLVSGAALLSYFGLMVSMVVRGLRVRDPRRLAIGIAMAATLAPALAFSIIAPRYLLAASVMLFVALAAWLGQRRVAFTGVPRMAGLLLLALACAGALETRHYRFQCPRTDTDLEASLRGLVEALEAQDIHAVYSVSGRLQWQIMFYADERVIARSRSARDRHPDYPRRVEAARAAGEPVALVGLIDDDVPVTPDDLPARVQRVGEDAFILLDPSPRLLRALGFELPG